MSRFSLRRNAETGVALNSKQSSPELKASIINSAASGGTNISNIKLCKSAKVSLKRIHHHKKKKTAAATTTTTATTNLIIKEEKDLEDDADDGEADELDEQAEYIEESAAESSTSPILNDEGGINATVSLVCSLPLNRIKDVIDKLATTKLKEEPPEEDDETSNKNAEEDLSLMSFCSGGGGSVVKIMCLYCEKKFASKKLQFKHVEKFHILSKERRCSVRNSTSTPPTPTKQKKSPRGSAATAAMESFPGCTYCKRSSSTLTAASSSAAAATAASANTNQILTASTYELEAIFVHLTECHADKYFGCKDCTLRFPNQNKLYKHLQDVHHKILPFACEDSCSKSKELLADNNDSDSMVSDKTGASERSNSKFSCNSNQASKSRLQKSQKTATSSSSSSASSSLSQNSSLSSNSVIACSTRSSSRSMLGAEEPLLTRLGLTQNRLPNNRKGVRLRRDSLLPEALFKSESSNMVSSAAQNSISCSSSATASSSKGRNKTSKNLSTSVTGDSEVIFRMPTRTELLSCVWDDDFYKDVISNVRNNLSYHMDGKLHSCSTLDSDSQPAFPSPLPQIRSTLVKSPLILPLEDSSAELHAATTLTTTTAFPTLLTAEQYGADAASKLRRPHTKHSWKWKWDNVKKFRIIHEGGKMVKKVKQSNQVGTRDLSKLDMWTQLTMRQKHELAYQKTEDSAACSSTMWQKISSSSNCSNSYLDSQQRDEKLRLNEQLNYILDLRLLPHIILEQNEQAIIKLENEEFGITSSHLAEQEDDSHERFMSEGFADVSFLSMMQLIPNSEANKSRTRLVLSGEWARPRCYLCICCGGKFEKLKSLEEHKMFRHSQIYCTHYEMVGRELLAGNLLQHLFLPKRALSRYNAELQSSMGNNAAAASTAGVVARRYAWSKSEGLIKTSLHMSSSAAEDESSDSAHSLLQGLKLLSHNSSCNSPLSTSLQNDECDTDTKTTLLVSPTHSLQSSSNSSFMQSSIPATNSNANAKQNSTHLPMVSNTCSTATAAASSSNICTKCSRKCNGLMDLYRHMLDCSGDYVWSMAKKRKYRYYCGSKKRRLGNKQHYLEHRRNKQKQSNKSNAMQTAATEVDAELQSNSNELNEDNNSSNFTKTKTPPRPRPSDAESIKKMLENLPPKRVCKTIFPAVQKTKKKSKNVQMLNNRKHKLFNKQVLRTTRSRQIASQAAKVLSKNKKKFPKGGKTKSNGFKLMATTRRNSKKIAKAIRKNAAVAKAKLQKNEQKDTQHENKNTELHDKQESEEREESEEKEEKQENVIKEVLVEENKTSKKEDKIVKKSKEVNRQETVNEENILLAEESCKSPKSAKSKAKSEEVVQEDYKVANESAVAIQVEESPKELAITETTAATKNVLEEVMLEEPLLIHTDNSNTHSTTTECSSTFKASNTQRLFAEGNNCSKKRKKGISDCIAMLTGKLEEKMKTEQPHAILGTAETGEILTANASDKKPPKRKTTCRKIVKTDAVAVPAATIHGNKTETTAVISTKKSEEIKTKAISTNIKQNEALNVKPLQTVVTPNVTRTIPLIPIELPPPPAPAPPLPPVLAVQPTIMPQNTIIPKSLPSPTISKEALATVSTPVVLPNKTVLPIPPRTVLNTSNALPVLPPATLLQKFPLFLPVDGLNNASGMLPTLPLVALPQSKVSPTALTMLQPMPLMQPPPAPVANMTAPLAPPNQVSNPFTSDQPLNLSSTAPGGKKSDNPLGSTQRSGFPARRQTICGFEARNFLDFDDMEPLDLSKKPKKPTNEIKTIDISAIPMQKTVTPPMAAPPAPAPAAVATPASLPPNSPAAAAAAFLNCSEAALSSLLPPGLLGLTPEALLTKHFYSNLELLKIPQIRNSIVNAANPAVLPNLPAVATPSSATAPTAATSTAALLTIPEAAPTPPQAALTPTNTSSDIIAVVTPNKSTPKKRNNSKTCNTADISLTPLNTSANTPSSSSKKDAAKNRPLLKMDDEVINHIDDAINSVINAVKASIYEEEEKQASQAKEAEIEASKLNVAETETTKALPLPIPVTMPIITTTAKKRAMRSKTMDCRPAALAIVSPIEVSTQRSMSPAQITEKLKETSNLLAENSMKPLPTLQLESQQKLHSKSSSTESLPDESLAEISKANVINDKPAEITEEPSNSKEQQKIEAIEQHSDVSKESPKDIAIEEAAAADVQPDITAEQHESTAHNKSLTSLEQMETKTTTTEITSCSISEENISNINNTSSGFHSSGQPSECTPAADVASVVQQQDPKKKQRKRRKNELAAIVADQLLESFKIDNDRRENLQKLENLAYDKSSEDLLLTGMLLMSSTKRAASTFPLSSSAEKKEEAKESSKRQKQQETTRKSKGKTETVKEEPIKKESKKKNMEASKAEVAKEESKPKDDSKKKSAEKLKHEELAKEEIKTKDESKKKSAEKAKEDAAAKEEARKKAAEKAKEEAAAKEEARMKAAEKLKEEALKKAAEKAKQEEEEEAAAAALKEEAKRKANAAKEKQEKKIEQYWPERMTRSKTPVPPKESPKAKENEPSEEETEVMPKRGRGRRQTKKGKAKVAETENISKLKTSLESFSIGIEKQLNEFEAKNAQNSSSVATNTRSNANNASTANKNSILRPSILSATLEQQQMQQQQPAAAKADNGKTVVSRRDPRLNKNLHSKEEQAALNKRSASTEKKLDEIGDMEEDNYLTEIAKNVNEKIMAEENEDFAFADGFEMANEMADDSNSKYYRPGTSMSVRSAPNFNDDHSNFGGSTCDGDTNTELMDMDLDDEMSVYTSYSQDLGRGRGRRRRRRRSILLTRKKPRRRDPSQEINPITYECDLCNKTFYTANSLRSHNMTLAHVSKLSAHEYLQSKSLGGFPDVSHVLHGNENVKPATTRKPRGRGRSRTPAPSMPDMSLKRRASSKAPISLMPSPPREITPPPQTVSIPAAAAAPIQTLPLQPTSSFISSSSAASQKKEKSSLLMPSRLNLNPDERLFFECANILKSAETTQTAANKTEDLNNAVVGNLLTSFSANDKISTADEIFNKVRNEISSSNKKQSLAERSGFKPISNSLLDAPHQFQAQQHASMFRDPPIAVAPVATTGYNKIHQSQMNNERNHQRSPTYCAISQFSAVTNTTTSRFKTKAAMKGYENLPTTTDLITQTDLESKSNKNICKLTELADIALGSEKPPHQNSDNNEFSSSSNENRPNAQSPKSHHHHHQHHLHNQQQQRLITPEYITISAAVAADNNRKEMPATLRGDRPKLTAETQSSTSSKTIMHSSIIKAAVEEHTKAPVCNKIIIPERPFKNIGLEEKDPIPFQKPKTCINLLTDDRSLSSASYSDRDDFDFNSMSCDEEETSFQNKTKNQTSDSSSSRATAKTFENKSLIMGRIFKNASSTKAAAAVNTAHAASGNLKNSNIAAAATAGVKVKSVGVQKDTAAPKADLNQLFDELRGETPVAKKLLPAQPAIMETAAASKLNVKAAATQSLLSNEDIKISSKQTAKSKAKDSNTRKPKSTAASRKSNKEITKMQSELGMSQEEIEKLIDEGQRKSKRRCATNRPKKLVEMWSSDEYEEFLSTKDIIALIEEKEQQEKRRKRKNSLQSTAAPPPELKEVETNPAPAATAAASLISAAVPGKRRNMRSMSVFVDRKELELLDIEEESQIKATKIPTKRQAAEKEPTETETNFKNQKTKAKKNGTKTAADSFNALLDNNKAIAEKSQQIFSSNLTDSKNEKAFEHKPQNSLNKKETIETFALSPSDDEICLADLKQQNHNNNKRNSRNAKKELKNNNRNTNNNNNNKNMAPAAAATSKGQLKEEMKIPEAAAAASNVSNINNNNNNNSKQKRNSSISNNSRINNNNNNNLSPSSSNSKTHPALGGSTGAAPKNKRKTPSNATAANRRKRPAAEKLYYWSSSSEEDFEESSFKNKHKAAATTSASNHQTAALTQIPSDNHTQASTPALLPSSVQNEALIDAGSSETQYQKHGWIVGDSHKKLVTLLAIAKGNKKVDNCGVKKNVSKKKS